jgi:hypothetical protein
VVQILNSIPIHIPVLIALLLCLLPFNVDNI